MITFYRLSGCHITEKGCVYLGSELMFFLTQLDLSNNDLKDFGIMLLSAGLAIPLCNLKKLRSVFMHNVLNVFVC